MDFPRVFEIQGQSVIDCLSNPGAGSLSVSYQFINQSLTREPERRDGLQYEWPSPIIQGFFQDVNQTKTRFIVPLSI